MQIDVHTGKKHAPIQTPSKGGVNSEVLAEVAQNWPQQVSHAQKDTIIRDFHSVMSSWPSTQALKSITCTSCAERAAVMINSGCQAGIAFIVYCFL